MTIKENNGKVAVITGAGTGIGKSAVLHLIQDGYQVVLAGRRDQPLIDTAQESGAGEDRFLIQTTDVSKEEDLNKTLKVIKDKFGNIDFIIHAVAYSDKNELNGRYIETSKNNFINSLSISCYSFTKIAKVFQPILNENGSLVTLSFYGANKVMPNYNVMGVAKAALETSVKYLSVDLGDQNIRVNAISAGPMRTLAGAAIANAREVFKYTNDNSSLKRNVNLEELGNSALYLVSEMSSAVTGEIHYVDCGFNIVGMPKA